MKQRLALIACLIVLSAALGGCSKCGWLWNEGGKACRADTPR